MLLSSYKREEFKEQYSEDDLFIQYEIRTLV